MLTGIEYLSAEAPPGPALGELIAEKDIIARDLDIMPNGEGLPDGRGTAIQGEKIYQQYCLKCHGENGLGDSGDQLAGARMQLTDEWPEKTIGTYWPYATTLFDFNRRSMPMEAPGSLSNNEIYAVTAYLLYLNGLIGERDELNASTLLKIKMPNREGFINTYKEMKRENRTINR